MGVKLAENRGASPRPILDAAWNGRSTFSIPETAKIIGVSSWRAYQWARAGEIPTVRIGGRVFVPRRALEQLLDVAPASGRAASPVA